MEYCSAKKKMKSCLLNSITGPWGNYVKWKQILYDFTHLLNIKNKIKSKKKKKKIKQTKHMDTENKVWVAREKGLGGGRDGGEGEMDKGDQIYGDVTKNFGGCSVYRGFPGGTSGKEPET